jgi:PhoPQ-activated pathogenicity-related protein
VQNSDKPTEVKLWQATNPTARDFRLMTIQDAWKSTPLKDEGGGRYLARVPRPAEGWTAYFVELTFAGVGAAPFKFTTGVHVTPETLPHPYTKPTPPR